LNDITDIAVSGLQAQRVRMTVTASNIANAETTRTADGTPYRRRDPVFRSESVGGPFASELTRAVRAVEVSRVAVDNREFLTRFDPGHPDADEFGFVKLPRVNMIEEQTNMLSASRAFEANLMVMRKVSSMADAALKIGA
jgi:flagellar basal-body rod protein FlgC